ncbi:hypothetical protein Q0F98_35750 [Paenibacillus amylolyticus]|nr:hypothetical protein Q0F98_35750 [Paenibacillus amylolyticus]
MDVSGLVILVMPIPYWIAAGALFIVGLGGAPIYPSIVHATPERFGEKASPSVIGLGKWPVPIQVQHSSR